MTIRFDDQVVIVTGSGNGLGKSHALEFARRGARVVVNDLGGARDGSGRSGDAAGAVVDQIKSGGGEAIANAANVADYDQVEAMVGEAIDKWGRVDVLINNAGILRDKTFAKMDLADFRMVMGVHLLGSVNCTKAVWDHMKGREYGRIVMTTSSTGLYGNFGQTNYGAAKLALVGFMNTLALEGNKYGIRVNSLSPVAATRMTEDLMPDQVLELLQPEAVTPAVIFMASEDAPTKQVIAAGAGGRTAENVAAGWDKIADTEGMRELQHGGEQTEKFLMQAAKALGIELGGGN
jgi:NAD(P)-dependent dehydrogenase (short-subunit alcohol dehydrogenase family)